MYPPTTTTLSLRITDSDSFSVCTAVLRTVPLCCKPYRSGVEAYCTYKNSRYYKDYNMYLSQLAAYNAVGPISFPYRPRFYYSVVNPLAAFDTDCSPKG